MEQEQVKAYFKPPARILVIDDSHLNRSFIVNAFMPPDYDVSTAVDAAEGIAAAKKLSPELILLDIMMPGMDGFEAAKILKSDAETRDVPIIFITALDAIQDKLKAFEAGAVDFVTKPFNHRELMARVKTHVELRRSVAQNQRMLTIVMEEKRNAAIARIAAGVSHNFNNMLGVSFGNIMFIESMIGRNLDPVAKEALTDVRKSLERMQSLVKQFLLLANRSSEIKGGKPSPSMLDLKEIVEDAIRDLSFQKSNAATPVEVKCEDRIPSGVQLYCDSAHLREIIHLVLNELVETTAGRASCLLETCSPGQAAKGMGCFRVFVTGIILHKDIEESIFEPFALPIANVGAGLSFSVAKHLVELNGGSISAEFSKSKDSITFMISLPNKAADRGQ